MKSDIAMTREEEQAFTVFMTAIDSYLDTMDDATEVAFQAWLDEHAEDEDLLALLLQTHEKFGDIFIKEIQKSAEDQTSAKN